jgi:glycine oxidase
VSANAFAYGFVFLRSKPVRIKTRVDYIIVGQGLAGSALALRLLHRNQRIVVFDRHGKTQSSRVAAGLFNPITGKLMTKSWMADVTFRELHSFYPHAEKLLGHKFFYLKPIYRPFHSIEEQNDWMAKSADRGLRDYIRQVFTQSAFGNQVHDPYGGILIRQCGYLDTVIFLEGVRNYLTSLASFRPQTLDQNQLEIKQDGVTFGDLEAKKIIFCTGMEQANDSFTRSIPLRPLKGETLTIETEQRLELIYNRGVYILPTTAHYCKVGATYEPNHTDPAVTETGRSELEQKIKDLLKMSYRVVNHEGGIRPTTPDRRPLLGAVSESENVVIFNGLGTKGVSLVPHFSRLLADWLMGEAEIPPAVNINRYKALSSKPREVV